MFLSLFWHLKIFQFSMYRMRYLAESRAFSHEFFTFIYIYIYIYIGSCHLVFPMLLTHYAPMTRMKSLQLIPHVLGQKNEIYYSFVTIHYHYSLLLFTCYYSFCLFKGSCPLYLKQVFCVLSSGLLP